MLVWHLFPLSWLATNTERHRIILTVLGASRTGRFFRLFRLLFAEFSSFGSIRSRRAMSSNNHGAVRPAKLPKETNHSRTKARKRTTRWREVRQKLWEKQFTHIVSGSLTGREGRLPTKSFNYGRSSGGSCASWIRYNFMANFTDHIRAKRLSSILRLRRFLFWISSVQWSRRAHALHIVFAVPYGS